MPYTRRHALHGTCKDAIDYIVNEEKTDDGLLVSGYQCNEYFANEEFEMNQRYWHDTNKRKGYHIIQSFDYRDTVIPEEAHEIALKLVKELYPDYQAVISTHIDKGHIHNHIILNAINLKGRKLEDRLANRREGLYALREASDELAKEYGYSVMKDFPKIPRYKKLDKQHVGDSWKSRLKKIIDELKLKCVTYDQLLESLSNEGYIIRNRGHYMSVKAYGQQRFTRLYKLGEGYTDEDLKEYFYKLDEKETALDFDNIVVSENELCNAFFEDAKTCRDMIYYSQKGLDGEYPKYFTSRKFERAKFERLKRELAFMNSEDIHCFDDINERIRQTEDELHQSQTEYRLQHSRNNTMIAPYELAEAFVEYHQEYLIYMETKAIVDDTKPTDRVSMYLKAKEHFSVESVDEVKEYLVEANKLKRETNQKYARITYLKQRLTNLNNLKGSAMSHHQHYIKGMSFHKNMINENRSNNDYYCVKLPYTKEYVYLEKECIVWNNYDVRANMYLIDDKKYILYDEQDNPTREVEGADLEEISKEEQEKFLNKPSLVKEKRSS